MSTNPSPRHRARGETETSRALQEPSSSPSPPKSNRSPVCYALAVVVIITLGLTLGLSFLPGVVDSPRFSSSTAGDQAVNNKPSDDSRQERSVSGGVSPSHTKMPVTAERGESTSDHNQRLFTKEELSGYDGSDESKPIYLSVLGQVFDVSRGEKFYGRNGGYSFFSGRDASRAFVSGEFSADGLVEDVTGVDAVGLDDWTAFYRKDYKYVGKLIGHFYDDHGEPTENLKRFQKDLARAKLQALSDEEERKVFPACNSHWAQGQGGTVWCGTESGGIKREWAGVPRRLFKPGSVNWRSVCVRTTGQPSYGRISNANRGDLDNPNLRMFDNCHPESISCPIPEAD